MSSVKAVTLCDMYALSNEDYQHVLDMFPYMRKQMEVIARERLCMILNTRRASIPSGDQQEEEERGERGMHVPPFAMPYSQLSQELPQPRNSPLEQPENIV